jgi:hypothetical protein
MVGWWDGGIADGAMGDSIPQSIHRAIGPFSNPAFAQCGNPHQPSEISNP